jgi:uncharacterized protein YodC (DUF2158 family)
MKRKIVGIAAAALLGGMVSTNAFAAGGGGHAGGHAGVIAGGGRVGALAVGGGLGGVRVSAGSRGPILTLTRDGRLYSVPLFAGSRFSPSNLYSTPLNSRQLRAPQANNYYFGSYVAPSQSGQGGTAYGGAYVSVVGGTSTKVAETCADLADPMTDIPVDQLRKLVHPTKDQQAELDQLKAASSEAKNVVAAACLTNPSASPVDRLAAAAKQSEAITSAAQILRPPLEKFYASLSDDQKASLYDADPQPQNVALLHAQDRSNENRTNLKVGARVKLRSGGPLMAVLSVSGTDVTCVWFDEAGQAETGTFPAASLM